MRHQPPWACKCSSQSQINSRRRPNSNQAAKPRRFAADQKCAIRPSNSNEEFPLSSREAHLSLLRLGSQIVGYPSQLGLTVLLLALLNALHMMLNALIKAWTRSEECRQTLPSRQRSHLSTLRTVLFLFSVLSLAVFRPPRLSRRMMMELR